MVGHFPLTIEVPDAIATQVLNQLFYELPVEDLPKYRERVLRVTPDEIERVARWFIRPAQLSVVLVGNADAFVKDLKGVGFGDFERIPIERVDLLSADFRAARRPGRPSDAPDDFVRRAVRRSLRRRAGRRAAPPRARHRRVRAGRRAIAGRRRPAGRPTSRLSVTGLTEVLGVLPRSWATMKPLVAGGRAEKPARARRDRLSRLQLPPDARIKRLGVPVIYYVSPQLWAWRAGRIKTMKRSWIACCRFFRSRRRSIGARAWTSASSAIR